MMRLFILGEDEGGMLEIGFRVPYIFQGRISFPCSQVQSLSRRSLVGNNVIYFIFFFIINEVRRRSQQGRTIETTQKASASTGL